MQEKDIEKLKFTKSVDNCNHQNVIGIYNLGANDGYICLDCGLKRQNKKDFKKIISNNTTEIQ